MIKKILLTVIMMLTSGQGFAASRWLSKFEQVVLDWFWILFLTAIPIFLFFYYLIVVRGSRLKAAAVNKNRLEKERAKLEKARAKLAKEGKIRLEKEKARLIKEEERVRIEEEKVRIEQQKLDKFLIGLHHSLPFYTRNDSQKYSQSNGDDFRWNNALNAIKGDDTTETSLYLVKVKDLDVGDEHHKIGTTTQEVSKRFLKSPDLELLEILYEFKMDARLALFAEFHFIREFRPTDNPEGIEKSSVMLDDTPKEFQKRFSGYTEVVKDTSVKKILSLMRNLIEYVAKADDLLTKKLTQE
jgi:exonuclease VII large subunit